MIVRFSVANWMSFRDRVTLSMVASLERQHGDRVVRIGRYPLRVLPVMALYGGNASGKTNLFKALSFAKTQIVEGSRPDARIPVIPFLLDKDRAQQPTHFEFDLLIDEVVYAFSFSVTREKVIEERLVRVSSTSERTLYDRQDRKIEFDGSLEAEQLQFLRFVFRGTRDNQLFLTNSISQNVQDFRPIHDWFNETLQIITPDIRFGLPSFHASSAVATKMSEMLSNYDTGISRMDNVRVPIEYIPKPVKNELKELDEGESVHLAGPSREYFEVTRKDGKLIASKCVTVHRTMTRRSAQELSAGPTGRYPPYHADGIGAIWRGIELASGDRSAGAATARDSSSPLKGSRPNRVLAAAALRSRRRHLVITRMFPPAATASSQL